MYNKMSKLNIDERAKLEARELNAKQVCALAFGVCDKEHTVTITTSDISSVILIK